MAEFVSLAHPRFQRAQRDIFFAKVEADCMTHTCRLLKEGDKVKLDACCQYGADTDVAERDAILTHRNEIEAILDSDAAAAQWFTNDEKEDADFPSGKHVRTERHGDGCVFLAHDGRGCAIHRASIENSWDFRGVKPHVCRLFPLSYDQTSIVLSDDYADYSCIKNPLSPTVYRVGRETLGDVFGDALVAAMDAAEDQLLSASVQYAVK